MFIVLQRAAKYLKERHTSLEWHEGEKIMTILIFGKTIPLNIVFEILKLPYMRVKGQVLVLLKNNDTGNYIQKNSSSLQIN